MKKIILATALLAGTVGLASTASAMPILGGNATIKASGDAIVQKAATVCSWQGCVHFRPWGAGYGYGYGYRPVVPFYGFGYRPIVPYYGYGY